MFSITFLVMSVTGIVFPYVKKDIFENSPATIKVLGLPLMSICGVIGAIFCSFMLYRCFYDKTAGGLGTTSMYIAAGIVVVSFVWYFAFKAYAKSKGEDVSQRYKEIPVE
jgi:amino acid transporter